MQSGVVHCTARGCPHFCSSNPIGWSVVGPMQSGVVRDTTDGERCRFACPHNNNDVSDEIGSDIATQPCVYAVRITEVFKGNYSVMKWQT